jgi:hypothetical protein
MDPDYEIIIHAYLDAYLVQWHIIYLVKSGIFNIKKWWRHFASFTGEFLSTWSIWFQPTQKIFHAKNYPNLPDFEELFFQIARFVS